MIDTTTTTTTQPLDRARIVARVDQLAGAAIEQAVMEAELPQPVAQAIRANEARRIADAIIDAKRVVASLAAHDKG